MENQVAVVETNNQVVEVKPKNYIQTILASIQQDFLAVNDGMDLDYVYLANWLRLTKTGQFVDKTDETVNFGPTIDVVFGQGEQRYMLWGAEDTPEDGQLIVAEKTREAAEARLQQWLEINHNVDRYTFDDIKLTYLSYVVPTKLLSPENEIPSIYIMSLPTSDSFKYGQYAKDIFSGKYKALGIPTRTGIANVITRVSSCEEKNDKHSWIGRKFEPVGMFKPEEFGIKVG